MYHTSHNLQHLDVTWLHISETFAGMWTRFSPCPSVHICLRLTPALTRRRETQDKKIDVLTGSKQMVFDLA